MIALVLSTGDLEARLGAFQTALDARVGLDQAVGVLMMSQDCTAEEALTTLRRAADNRNMDLPDVAAAVLQSFGSSRHGDEPGSGRQAR